MDQFFTLIKFKKQFGVMNNRGISSIDNIQQQQEKYQYLGQQILESQRNQLETQLQVFQNALISFKTQYSEEIVKNSDLCAEFSEICNAFGIDPLIVSSSLDGENVNEEEKLNQLCLKINEFCSITRPLNGGIILVKDLIELINKDTWLNSDLKLAVKETDILQSLNHLKILGDELQLLKIGKRNYIKSIPQELNNDQNIILSTADTLGFVSLGLLRDNFDWKSVRCKSNLDELVSNGLLWVDEQGENEETKYWISSWINS